MSARRGSRTLFEHSQGILDELAFGLQVVKPASLKPQAQSDSGRIFEQRSRE
jgi:hypothetical protein